jgi:hypothetical protein
MIKVDNKKIVGRMAEKHVPQEALGVVVGLSVVSIGLRLRGYIDWRITELVPACDFLELNINDVIMRLPDAPKAGTEARP